MCDDQHGRSGETFADRIGNLRVHSELTITFVPFGLHRQTYSKSTEEVAGDVSAWVLEEISE